MTLKDKSLHDLRAIAQGHGIVDIFQKQHHELVQAIEMQQQAMVPEPVVTVPPAQYDARLMTKVPSRKTDQDEITEALAAHIARGLHLTFPNPEEWHMAHGRKEDTGTVRQPLRNVVRCADEMLK